MTMPDDALRASTMHMTELLVKHHEQRLAVIEMQMWELERRDEQYRALGWNE